MAGDARTAPRTDISSLQAQFQAQLDKLGEKMEAGFRRVEEKVDGYEERVRAVEQKEAGCQPLLSSRIESAWRQIDTNTNDIRAMKETIAELRQANRLLSWIGGLLGSTLIAWLIGQLLGLIK